MSLQTTFAITRMAQGTGLGESLRLRWNRTWTAYLVAIACAELVVTLWSPTVGVVIHFLILFALLVHATVAPPSDRPLLLSLTLAPVIRISSLSLPLAQLPIIYWYLVASLPIFVAGGVACWVLGLHPRDLNMQWGHLPTQYAIGLIGVPLGMIEYVILRPAAAAGPLTVQALVIPVLILIFCTGLLEEFVFRGVMQTTAQQVLGPSAVVYVSAVFASLHIGYRSVGDCIFVFCVGMLFSIIVRRTRAMPGVVLAHGLNNVVLLLLLPLIIGAHP